MSQENVIMTQAVPKSASQVERRSKMETYCDILSAIAAGAHIRTHILYKANLSWTVMQSYVAELEAIGLVESKDDDGRRIYGLSDKGFRLLKQFLEIKEELNPLPNA
jgi:predicted transcriptional regulator